MRCRNVKVFHGYTFGHAIFHEIICYLNEALWEDQFNLIELWEGVGLWDWLGGALCRAAKSLWGSPGWFVGRRALSWVAWNGLGGLSIFEVCNVPIVLFFLLDMRISFLGVSSIFTVCDDCVKVVCDTGGSRERQNDLRHIGMRTIPC